MSRSSKTLLVNLDPQASTVWSDTGVLLFSTGDGDQLPVLESLERDIDALLDFLVASKALVADATVEITLSSQASPGLCISLGQAAMAPKMRSAFATHRLEATFGLSVRDWEMRIDQRRAIGPALAFAAPRTAIERLQTTLGALAPRNVSVMPALVWAWSRWQPPFINGVFGLIGQRETTLSLVDGGLPQTLHVERGSQPLVGWDELSRREANLHGHDFTADQQRVVIFPNARALHAAPSSSLQRHCVNVFASPTREPLHSVSSP